MLRQKIARDIYKILYASKGKFNLFAHKKVIDAMRTAIGVYTVYNSHSFEFIYELHYFVK